MIALNRIALAAIAALTLIVAAPATAHSEDTSCWKSYTAGQILADPVGDSADAPDISKLQVSLGVKCDLVVGLEIATPISPFVNETYEWFIDSDGNPGSGEPFDHKGSDYSINLRNGVARLLRYVNGAFVDVGPVERIKPTYPYTFERVKVHLFALGAKSNVPIRFYGRSAWEGNVDHAPQVGAAPISLTPQYFYPPCKVPKVAGYTLKKAKERILAANCKVGKVQKRVAPKDKLGKPFATLPAKGQKAVHNTRVTIYIGKLAK